jgi:hypothetical protein
MRGLPDQCSFHVREIFDAERMDAVQRAWLAAGSAEPIAYLRHRAEVFRFQLSLNSDQVCYPLHFGMERNSLGITHEPTFLYRLAEWCCRAWPTTARSIAAGST